MFLSPELKRTSKLMSFRVPVSSALLEGHSIALILHLHGWFLLCGYKVTFWPIDPCWSAEVFLKITATPSHSYVQGHQDLWKFCLQNIMFSCHHTLQLSPSIMSVTTTSIEEVHWMPVAFTINLTLIVEVETTSGIQGVEND